MKVKFKLSRYQMNLWSDFLTLNELGNLKFGDSSRRMMYFNLKKLIEKIQQLSQENKDTYKITLDAEQALAFNVVVERMSGHRVSPDDQVVINHIVGIIDQKTRI